MYMCIKSSLGDLNPYSYPHTLQETYGVTIAPKVCGDTSQVTSNNNTYHIISKYRKSIVQTAGTLTKKTSYHSHKTCNHSHTSQLIKLRWRVSRCQQNKTNPSH